MNGLYSSFLFFSDSCLLSFNPSSIHSFGAIYAHTYTSPHKLPVPHSSIPIMYFLLEFCICSNVVMKINWGFRSYEGGYSDASKAPNPFYSVAGLTLTT